MDACGYAYKCCGVLHVKARRQPHVSLPGMCVSRFLRQGLKMGLINWSGGATSPKVQLLFTSPGLGSWTLINIPAGITDTHQHTQHFVCVLRIELRYSYLCSKLFFFFYQIRHFSNLGNLFIHEKNDYFEVMAHVSNPSPLEEESGGSRVLGLPRILRESEASWGYKRPWLKKASTRMKQSHVSRIYSIQTQTVS